MKILQIDVKTAQELYAEASPEFKILLEQNFTKEELSSNILDRIKSYEDACIELGIEPMNEDEMFSLGFRQDEIDRRKLETITFVLNKQEYLNWDNSSYRWFPRFCFNKSSKFTYDDTGYNLSNIYISKSLCFKNVKHAEYAGKQFINLYESIINPKNDIIPHYITSINLIKQKAKNRRKEWRLGQAIYIYSYELFPSIVTKITGTDDDCFYNDDKINNFYKKLEYYLKESNEK